MTLGRVYRTVRYLNAEQWRHRFVLRGKRATMRFFPAASRRRIERSASHLPLPDPGRARLLAAARPVAALQNAVYGSSLDGVQEGRFTLLNREYDFGRPEDVSWRGTFHEGNNPLRRMLLAYMGYAVRLLARGRPADLALTLTLLRSLEAQNSFAAPGVFRDVWNAYTASQRLINLLAGLALYREAGGEPDRESEQAILSHVRFAAAFVLTNLEKDLGFNHLMKNLVALSVYQAGVVDPIDALDDARRAIPDVVRQNLLSDGGHVERSPMYHVLAMLDLDILAICEGEEGALGPFLNETRGRAKGALAVMTHPDGDIALFNDSWLGEAPTSATLIGGFRTPDTARLTETGYVRIGRGGDAVVFDCGPCGPDENPGHAHADFLSLEVSVSAKRLVVDPGVPTYTAGALRDESRSAASHNGPHVAGHEPIEFWKSFRVGRRGRAGEIRDPGLDEFAPLWCAGWQSGYERIGLSVKRFVGLWPGSAVLIADLWIGPRKTQEASRYLVAGQWRLVADDPPIFEDGKDRVRSRALAGSIAGVDLARSWPHFGVEETAHALVVEPESRAHGRQAALWLAWSDAVEPTSEGALAELFQRLARA